MVTKSTAKQEELLIIDGNALLHRAWHALPPLSTKDGTIVNAVYGFLSLLFNVLKVRTPTALAVTFDKAGKTFRHEAYEAYKATRVKQPDELYAQIPILKDVLQTLGLPVYEASGFEADDVIASIAELAAKRKNTRVTILTGDMDTMQLVTDRVRVLTPKKGISDTVEYGPDEVRARYDLDPDQMVDYKALRGDPSDNIPGVKGIGEKTATELLSAHGTLEKLFVALKKKQVDAKPGVLEKLAAGVEAAAESKKLVTLVRDLDTGFAWEDAKLRQMPRQNVVAALGALGFRTLIGRIPPQLVDGQSESEVEQIAAPDARRVVGKKGRVTQGERRIVETAAAAKDAARTVAAMKTRAIFPVFAADGALDALVISDGKATVVVSGQHAAPLIEALRSGENWFAEAKPFLRYLLSAGHALVPVSADVGIMSYLLNPGTRSHGLDAEWLERMGKEFSAVPTVQGRLLAPNLAEIAPTAAARAEAVAVLVPALTTDIAERHQQDLLARIELPLIPILAEMEHAGITLNTAYLKKLSSEMHTKIDALTAKIHEIAGGEFNINSPLQIKEVLFEKLRIPTDRIKKTDSGAGLSTAASELEKLRGLHPIIDLISDYRELAKLTGTYVDALPLLVAKDGRVHTTFNQTVAATGRLSSSDPGLQNIPMRGSYGPRIREAFVAAPGTLLLSADYSQIELRIVASLAGDKSFIAAFNAGEDIHTRTACEIWDVTPDKVDRDMRRKAKAINFGIIFGMGAHGLSQSGDMTFGEAKTALAKYFEIHTAIRDFMDLQKALARKQGYVETVFGRRRYLPEITSGIPFVRAGAERMAINHPVQGAEADLMKLAMIAVEKRLKKEKLVATMLLQVHDELVFEVKKSDAKELGSLVSAEMEKVHRFAVPIVVNVEVGENWGEMQELP
ncbi:MAG: DNA polymerase I [Patescibacteria group bacterium]